jgi:hypothetical protein
MRRHYVAITALAIAGVVIGAPKVRWPWATDAMREQVETTRMEQCVGDGDVRPYDKGETLTIRAMRASLNPGGVILDADIDVHIKVPKGTPPTRYKGWAYSVWRQWCERMPKEAQDWPVVVRLHHKGQVFYKYERQE